jgi:LCP family protein required for cell wall assembly
MAKDVSQDDADFSGSDQPVSLRSSILAKLSKLTANPGKAIRESSTKLIALLKRLKASPKFKPTILASLAIVVVLIIAIASVYGYYLHRYNQEVKMNQGYADSWEELSGNTTPAKDESHGEPSALKPDTGAAVDQDETQNQDENTLDFYEGINNHIIRKKPIDKNIENILLIGVDAGDIEQGNLNSDTMILVSFNKKTKTVRAVSLMRDIWAYYPNRGGYDKLNAAFSYGGPGQTVNIINENFNLDIQKYIVTNFDGLSNLVDIMGGIEQSITNAESRYINGLSGGATYNLTGAQALDYARIRVIDSDFSRVERQRNVILAMLNKFLAKPPQQQLSAIDKSLKYVRSNIPASQITGDLLDLVRASSTDISQMTVPEWGYYSVNEGNIWYMSLDWNGQNESLHNFLYE